MAVESMRDFMRDGRVRRDFASFLMVFGKLDKLLSKSSAAERPRRWAVRSRLP